MADQTLEPAAVITRAVARLRADGHDGLAAELDQVGAYLRRPVVTQTEIIEASDGLLEQTPRLLHPSTK